MDYTSRDIRFHCSLLWRSIALRSRTQRVEEARRHTDEHPISAGPKNPLPAKKSEVPDCGPDRKRL